MQSFSRSEPSYGELRQPTKFAYRPSPVRMMAAALLLAFVAVLSFQSALGPAVTFVDVLERTSEFGFALLFLGSALFYMVGLYRALFLRRYLELRQTGLFAPNYLGLYTCDIPYATIVDTELIHYRGSQTLHIIFVNDADKLKTLAIPRHALGAKAFATFHGLLTEHLSASWSELRLYVRQQRQRQSILGLFLILVFLFSLFISSLPALVLAFFLLTSYGALWWILMHRNDQQVYELIQRLKRD